MRLTITFLFCLCSIANATWVEFNNDGFPKNVGPLDIQNDLLQPGAFQLNLEPTWFPGQNGSLGSSVFANATVTLLEPVPVGAIDASKFTVTNMTGGWGSSLRMPPRGWQGTFDIPIQINAAQFGGVDDFSVSVVPTVSPAYIVNGTFDGNLIQHQAPAMSIQYSSVPEPSQYLALGLIGVGCVVWKKLRHIRSAVPGADQCRV